ncbi:DUF6904 family protein [Flavobacterium subsaxonicum]|uniref:Uncharacterized protein n=1 Tax=Flavobacterium subsaxonicum WB 4.1-42 = DSM 21790 TaxID=1121898 RepID=A0A0A2MPZ6_9FLAO|nr:hypothetical protein [Flavobacterium subsaxonicum]KGO93631.1 hypothetical protein Q766_06620 [Flavobacterium subsaxonicum WB 4.1-42 = DSM 21790]
MLYIVPTQRGLGIEIWGTYEDLTTLYGITANLWGTEDKIAVKGSENRDELISGFSYELRKAYEGRRLNRKHSHFSFSEIQYYGASISWVHILFSLGALRYNMRYQENSKLDIAVVLQIEYWLEEAMNKYDTVGANSLIPYITEGITSANPYSYQFMRAINAEYFQLRGGKNAFRKLPRLLRRANIFSDEYKEYMNFLTTEALRLNCEISNLELMDDDIDYDTIKW